MTDAIDDAEISPADAQFLIRYLRDRDANCPLCGYNLRNLASPRCPECGRHVKIKVSLVEPYLKAWLLLVVATCAGGGIGVLLLAMVIVSGRVPRSQDLPDCASFWLMVPMAMLGLWLRNRFLRARKPLQWIIAGAATAYLVVVFYIVTTTLK